MLLKNIPNWLLNWPRWLKRAVALSLDALLCWFTLWAGMSLRLERVLPLTELPWQLVGLALPLFISHGLYRAIFRYAGMNAFTAMARAAAIYGVVFAGLVTVIGVRGVPRSVGVSQPLMLFLLVGLSRAFVRYWLGGVYKEMWSGSHAERVLIYGAGSAGRQLAAGLSTSKDMQVVGYLDDDERLHGQVLNGIRIHGAQDLTRLTQKGQVSLVLLAIPSAHRARRNAILNLLSQYKVKVRTLPPLAELVQGRDSGQVQAADLKELDLEDLLGRDPVTPNPLMMGKTVTGKTVMVTGAGGSIGSELCRQILRAAPRKLLLVELNEYSLYTIHQELERFVLEELSTDVDLIPLLASVRDAVRMGEILSTWSPETVYHAAAYKHVPLVEHNHAHGGFAVGALWRDGLCAGEHRQGGSPHQRDGREQAPGRDGVAGQCRQCGPQGRQDMLQHGALWQCAGVVGFCGAFVPPADQGGWPHHLDACRGDAVFHDHSRGGAVGDSGRCHGRWG
jgi:FlaA1/EpsC-like NDP-sugar epimerase